jgi:hypothetical protein
MAWSTLPLPSWVQHGGLDRLYDGKMMMTDGLAMPEQAGEEKASQLREQPLRPS